MRDSETRHHQGSYWFFMGFCGILPDEKVG